MATKKPTTSTVGFGRIKGLVETISKKTGIVIDNQDSKKQTFINTGIYVLNALLSRSIRRGGIMKNRITIFAGPPQCGKSYICYNIARNAQLDEYNVIYIDTEYSIEKEELSRFGVDIDPERLMLIRSNKVEDLKLFLTQLLDQLKQDKIKGLEVGKTMIILDSIGQLASIKEVEDALEGKNKADMSRAKAIKSLFRIINSDLGYLNIPLIATNHIYMTQDLFPQMVMGGGEGAMYSASTVIYMTIAKLKTGEEETDHSKYVKDIGQAGIIVTAKARKNRMAKPMMIKFEINHTEGTNPYKGLEEFCTFENFNEIGIAKVKKIEIKGEKGKKDFTFENNESTKGAKYYVKHLDKMVSESQLFNAEIFTEDIINKLDPIIEKAFSYVSYEEQQNIMKKMDEAYAESEGDTFDIESDDSEGKLFS